MRTFSINLTTGATVQFKCPVHGRIVGCYSRSGRAIVSTDPSLTLAALEAIDGSVTLVVAYALALFVDGLSYPCEMGQVFYINGPAATTVILNIAD